LSQNEFINFLENIKRLYKINFKGNLTNSINLMIFGEKRNLLTEYKIYNNKEMIKNKIEKLKKKIEKDNDLKKILKKLNKILGKKVIKIKSKMTIKI
jgi:fructose-1,6-bisphosphatase/sedoheptulose 1,7-bisphosphatase-like protein